MRTLTPEQREAKQKADRDRRAAKKAGTFMPKTRPVQRMEGYPNAAASSPVPVAPALAPVASTPRLDRNAAAITPKRRGPGAPRVAERMTVITFKGLERHRKLFYAAGGGEWLRKVLEDGEASGHIKLGRAK